jgi:hypothetical protein
LLKHYRGGPERRSPPRYALAPCSVAPPSRVVAEPASAVLSVWAPDKGDTDHEVDRDHEISPVRLTRAPSSDWRVSPPGVAFCGSPGRSIVGVRPGGECHERSRTSAQGNLAFIPGAAEGLLSICCHCGRPENARAPATPRCSSPTPSRRTVGHVRTPIQRLRAPVR